jgi:hypothetical protein
VDENVIVQLVTAAQSGVGFAITAEAVTGVMTVAINPKRINAARVFTMLKV